MKYTTVRIEGAILSADILDKIEQGELGGQLAKDFGFDPRIKVKDEIAKAWADAQDLWRIFKRQREKVSAQGYGTTETRNFWMIPLLSLFGYDVKLSKAETVNGKSYAISHRTANLDGFPFHIVGFNDSLDRKREEGGARMSPHALLQEYINLTENLYAVVTNGLHLRLLRNSSRLIRLSFIEFDIETMMDEEHFADFAVMYRLLHSSRMPVKKDLGAESLIEKYHQDALDSGSRIREGLSHAVEISIGSFANGFLNHPANAELREKIENREIKASDFYQYQLRLIYRLLFLMVIEERNLVFTPDADKNKREIYYEFYSINRLRKLCEKRYLADQRFNDLWIALKNTFHIFESESRGKHLSIHPLAGELFGYGAIGILNQCMLDNKTLLECLRNLNVFVNKNTGQVMRINYASLNVEEFGSVYEGLLEYAPAVGKQNGLYKFDFIKGTERSSSGSHYTPDELVHPLIRHSLDHIIKEKLALSANKSEKERALLSIRACDVACGSGHILLNVARRIGIELARVRTGEDQPSPAPLRQAIRDVIKSCIYGVDKNPLAVELCKVALWLEAHNPGEPLNFLDHHIKCGDSIVGLAHKEELENGIPDEAFKKMPDDDKNLRADLAKQNKKERANRKQKYFDFGETVDRSINDIHRMFEQFNRLPENTIEEIEYKRKEYGKMTSGANWLRLKTLADIQVAQFFIPKDESNAKKIVTDQEYLDYLSGIKVVHGQKAGFAGGIAAEKKFFHWFLEFPEVFVKGGFDCILGNPPYMGGKKISGIYGNEYLNWLIFNFAPAGGLTDLVAYFLRRINTIIAKDKFLSIITTNTIAQGDTREGGLGFILKKGNIVFAIKSIKWPGVANLEVSLIAFIKGKWAGTRILNNEKVDFINSYFGDSEDIGSPYPINCRKNICFQGSVILGTGFILDNKGKQALFNIDSKYENIIFPYLIGDDINHDIEQKPSRYVINFFDWPEEKAQKYTECYNIVKERVYPERQEKKDKGYRTKWWQFGRRSVELYSKISKFQRIIVTSRVTKYLNFSFVPNNYVYDVGTNAILIDKYSNFLILQSSLNETWSRKYGSSLRFDLRYTNTDCFENFPFPQKFADMIESQLDQTGSQFYEHRRRLMLKIQLGLTKTYNQFHNRQLSIINGDMPDKEIEKQYCKETLNLWNHLKRQGNTCSFNEAVEGILELRRLHKEMDKTVLKAYGWTDINLAHDFYEVDYLPENDRIRYTISPDARKEILKRLLKLNHEIHEQEQKEGKPLKTKTKKSNNLDAAKQMNIF